MSSPAAPREGEGLSPGAVFAYALGSVGTGVFSTVPTVLLLYYCTETLRIGAGWASLIVFAPKAWAIVWDPLVGAWSDRTASRFGRRRPFMAAGAVGLVVAFAALFAPPALGRAGAAVWAGGAYFALATLYSLFAVPYVAIPAQIGRTEAERSRLVSTRMVLVMLGVLAGAAGAPALVQAFGGGRGGYAHMGWIVALACGLAMTPPILMLRGRDPPFVSPAAGAARESFRAQAPAVLRSAPFRALVAAYLLQLTAVGIVSSAAPYLVTKVFGRGGGDIGVALAVLILTATTSIPVWSGLARRFGERRILAAAVLLYVAAASALGAATLAASPSQSVGWTAVLSLFAAVGVPFGGIQVLPFIVVSHIVAAEAKGVAEGAMTGVWTASEKLGLALGPAATGLALGVGGGAQGAGFHIFLLLGPAALAALSLAPLAGAFSAAQSPDRRR